MENRIVLLANLKGGVGKTSLCAHFANWLTEKNCPVTVIDADLQQSLVRFRATEIKENGDENAKAPWSLAALNTSDVSSAEAVVKNLKHIPEIVLIDCPGNLDAGGMMPILRAADIIIVPFSYDDIAMDTTGLFVRVASRVSGAKLVFVPNRINPSEGTKSDKEALAEDLDILSSIGNLVPVIQQSVHVKRFSTMRGLTAKQHALMDAAFNETYNFISKEQ